MQLLEFTRNVFEIVFVNSPSETIGHQGTAFFVCYK